MRIISCHIDGFGKINNEDFSFENGLNIFREDNGFGKSTLATFIKVMLYGFEDEKRKSLQDKEREKYRPWNKGTYGGRMCFEVKGKAYEVSRVFGKNENDDSFEVRESESNNLVDIFDKSELGSQIFGIDRDSFFRTAYIAAHDLNKREEKVTDSIRAKLGNLTDATDDINNYENVCSKIDKKLNEYSPDRKTGLIKSLKSNISEIDNELRKADDIEKAIEINENQMKLLNDKLERDKEKLESLKKELQEVNKTEILKEKKETYNSYLGELEESRKKAKEIEDNFGGRIPDKEELIEAKSSYFEYRQLLKQMDENHFYKDDNWEKKAEIFKEGTPTDEEIKEYINLAGNEKDKRRELLTLSTELDKAVDEYNMKKQEEVKERNLRIQAETDRNNSGKKSLKIIFLIVSILLIIAGAASLIISGFNNMLLMITGGVCALVGVILMVLSLLIKGKIEAKLEELPKADRNEALSNSEEAKKKQAQIKDTENEIILLNGQIERFLSKYGYSYDKEEVVNVLLELMKLAADYREGADKIRKYNELSKECEKRENQYEAFLKKTGVALNDDIVKVFESIQDVLAAYGEINQEIIRKKTNVEKYEADNDIGELLKDIPEVSRSREDIMDDTDDINEELDKDKENLHRQRNKIEELEEEKRELLNLKNDREEKSELLTSLEREYNLMKFTREYLTKAKDGLSNKYTGPTMKAFKEYCSMFLENPDDFRMDTNFEMTRFEEGLQRKIKDLSSGQKDLTDLCMRMALVSAMYSEEKPFIIMDDPFVNLDDKNLVSGMKLLDELSKEYQIIYFTCHKARGGDR